MIQFEGKTETLGYIPFFINSGDPRPAAEQIHTAYAHGGGWKPFEGFQFLEDPFDISGTKIQYPGDPPLKILAWATLRDETIMVFELAWTAIQQKDGSVEISRLD